MGNYIKIDRKIVDWEWWHDINTCRVFIFLLLKANWKDENWKGLLIKRGSYVSSLDKMAIDTDLTRDEVRTAIKHLKNTKEITTHATRKYTVFTVVNYDLYQNNPTQTPTQIPYKSPTIPLQIPLREEYKEVKQDNNIVATPDEPQHATVSFGEDSFEIRCVDMIIESCLKTFPNSKVPRTLPDKQKWAIEIDRMKRLDGRTESDIMHALNYAIKDSFWQTNIRSAKKFREKFETLIVQSKGKAKGSSRNSFNNFEQRDYDFDALEQKLLKRK